MSRFDNDLGDPGPSACVECHIQLSRGLSRCVLHRPDGLLPSASKVFTEIFGPWPEQKSDVDHVVDFLARKFPKL